MTKVSENHEGNNANTLLGTILTKSVTFKIEIRELDKNVPFDELENFKEWLKHKALEVGTGRQHEHYAYTDNYQDDIGVSFFVNWI